MSPTTEPTLWQRICWPVIVCALLGGHMFLMLIALTFALAAPPEPVGPMTREAGHGDAAEIQLPASTGPAPGQPTAN
ncbi:hypothetical protein KOR34_52090 [Posidoniimonas corsicana]|uniref:Uncharacterized protein n=1 Tax=Posidoniimonas corsicana TaxID=1938618 RepID=A0A5C5UUT7_9BACT|nr:hypothetical protein [Posidoniimonas corsicana]TWT29397.1 hypothetical protein KOR34_52090 [Posidoniimonas corsicana]